MSCAELWGVLWGCSFNILAVNSEMQSNGGRMAFPGEVRLAGANLATVSNIAQGVGTLGNDVRAVF